jgi:hypothetical protein
LRVNETGRYFEQADGTPFNWLGDTWWSGLSTRLSWVDFRKLTADRQAKGFTVIQIAAGLIPSYEEQEPSDPGFCNEGGSAWTPEFKQINPHYFDYADRRILHLLDSGLVPAIVGAWSPTLGTMGIDKLKKHWRYIIARYGAFPVFWIAGGEVFDPPEAVARKSSFPIDLKNLGGWTDVVRYIRATDPVHHPVTVHEIYVADDLPLQDESLTDFELLQPSHAGWPSIAAEISQLNTRYARTAITKPLVVGEIGYEAFGEEHFANFQRAAFWLGTLNGAAGHTYGADGTWESYTSDKPFHRLKRSLMTWEEGMNLPGSYQIAIGAKLLRQYPWWRFKPHPEWVSPRGTTLLEPRGGINEFHVDVSGEWDELRLVGFRLTESEWRKRNGNFRLPYATGIPGEMRIVYMPYFGILAPPPPTILGLEAHVPYNAYYWDPSLGVKFDLGAIERSSSGELIREDSFFEDGPSSFWTDHAAKSTRADGRLTSSGNTVAVLNGVCETNFVASVDLDGVGQSAGLLLRFHDVDNYTAAMYSAKEKIIYIVDRQNGLNGASLGSTPTPNVQSGMRLTAEVSGGWAAVSLADGQQTCTSEIVPIKNTKPGSAGLIHTGDDNSQFFRRFELRLSRAPRTGEQLEKRLYDARGDYRGLLKGGDVPSFGGIGVSSWDDFGKEKVLLLDAYRPDRLPYARDWILVLERQI